MQTGIDAIKKSYQITVPAGLCMDKLLDIYLHIKALTMGWYWHA